MRDLYCVELLWYMFLSIDVKNFCFFLIINCVVNVFLVYIIVILNCVIIYVVWKIFFLLMLLKILLLSFVVLDVSIGLLN